MTRIHLRKHKKEGKKAMELMPLKRFVCDPLESFFLEPFSSFGFLKALRTPAIDISEKDNKVIVRADIQGVKKSDIKIHVEKGILTITGETKRHREVKKEDYYCSERSFGKIQRSICLPEGVEEGSVKASYKDGVLTIEMLKTKEALEKGKDIEVE